MKTSKRIVTETGRISFPSLYSLNEMSGKYSCDLLFDAATDILKLEALVKEVWEDFLKTKDPAVAKMMRLKGRMPIRNGDEKAHLAGYPGTRFINAKNKNQPKIVGGRKGPNGEFSPIIDPDEVYGGCYAKFILEPYAYDQKGNCGVAFSLIAVQKVKDGAKFVPELKVEDYLTEVAGDDEY